MFCFCCVSSSAFAMCLSLPPRLVGVLRVSLHWVMLTCSFLRYFSFEYQIKITLRKSHVSIASGLHANLGGGSERKSSYTPHCWFRRIRNRLPAPVLLGFRSHTSTRFFSRFFLPSLVDSHRIVYHLIIPQKGWHILWIVSTVNCIYCELYLLWIVSDI